jgi:hypothetical protein
VRRHARRPRPTPRPRVRRLNAPCRPSLADIAAQKLLEGAASKAAAPRRAHGAVPTDAGRHHDVDTRDVQRCRAHAAQLPHDDGRERQPVHAGRLLHRGPLFGAARVRSRFARPTPPAARPPPARPHLRVARAVAEPASWSRPVVGGVVPCERYSHSCVAIGSRLVSAPPPQPPQPRLPLPAGCLRSAQSRRHRSCSADSRWTATAG